MTLGLTNGTDNVGLTRMSSDQGLAINASIYGANVGDAITTTTNVARSVFGVTTDPAKSGIVVSKDNSKYLFFFIN